MLDTTQTTTAQISAAISAPISSSTSPTPALAARMAVFVDIENVAGYCDDMQVPVDITPIMNHLSTLARPIVRRSFGDVMVLPARFVPYQIRRMLKENHVTHEDIPHSPTSHSKNSADIRLAVDAIALAYQRPDITHFAVMSNDRDFLPLFNHLREMGKIVIGCGPSRVLVNKDYRSACDMFVFHDEIVIPPTPVVHPAHENNMADADGELHHHHTGSGIEPIPAEANAAMSDVDRLLTAIHSLQAEGKPTLAAAVGTRMRELFPYFNVKAQYGGLKAFCLEQVQTGKIRLENAEFPLYSIYPAQAAGELSSTPAAETPPPPVATNASVTHEVSDEIQELTDQYRQWARSKMKVPMPTPFERQCIYDSLEAEINSWPMGDSMPLRNLAWRIGDSEKIVRNHIDGNTVFRVLYSLFRGRAMRCAPTADGYNPTVLGLNVPAWKMDITFYNNLITIFTRDTTVANLPSVKAAWDALLYPPERTESADPVALTTDNTELAATAEVFDVTETNDNIEPVHTDFADTEPLPEAETPIEIAPELELELPPEPTAEAFDAETESKKTVKVTARRKISKPAEEHFTIAPETPETDSDSEADLFPPA